MAKLKEGTLKITVTEAALEAFTSGEFPRVAQCDLCLVFIAQKEVGYRDESRTECRECHSCDWRCEDTWNADITSGVEHSF